MHALREGDTQVDKASVHVLAKTTGREGRKRQSPRSAVGRRAATPALGPFATLARQGSLRVSAPFHC
eukprot:10053418-Alexandrium_andersonii.AAC.1